MLLSVRGFIAFALLICLPTLGGCQRDQNKINPRRLSLAGRDRIAPSLGARTLDDFLALKDDQIDLARVALLVSQELKTNINPDGVLFEINRITETILNKAQDELSSQELILLINNHLFQEISPLGGDYTTNPLDGLLCRTVRNKKGNSLGICLLHLSIAQRLGIPIKMRLLPNRCYLRFEQINIEPTAKGANWEDGIYAKLFHPPLAHRYNRDLKNKEIVALLLTNRAWVLLRTGQKEQAISDCVKALALAPDFVEAFYCKCCILYESKAFKNLLDETAKVLKADQHNHAAYFFRCLVWKEMKQWDKAAKDATSAIELNPSLHKAYHVRAMAHMEKKEYDAALSDLDRAVKLMEHKSSYFLTRACAKFEMGRMDQALLDFDAAIDLDPSSHMAYFRRGLAHLKNNAPKKALADLTQTITLKPDFRTAYFERGMVYSRFLKNPQLAAKDFDKFDEMGKDDGF